MTAPDNRLTNHRLATLARGRPNNNNNKTMTMMLAREVQESRKTLAELDALRPLCGCMGTNNLRCLMSDGIEVPCPYTPCDGRVPLGVWIATLIDAGNELASAYEGLYLGYDTERATTAHAAWVALPKAPES